MEYGVYACSIMLVVVLVGGAAFALASPPQQVGSVTNISVPGLATITLAAAVDALGAVAEETTDYVDRIRCVAVYSAIDNANDTDVEGTVDGTVWHLIDTADPNVVATFLLDDMDGPWASMRANVISLGVGVDVTITCLATLRR
jgi:hypothetical protein